MLFTQIFLSFLVFPQAFEVKLRLIADRTRSMFLQNEMSIRSRSGLTLKKISEDQSLQDEEVESMLEKSLAPSKGSLNISFLSW